MEFIHGSHDWDERFQPKCFGDTKGHDDYEHNPNYIPIPDIDAAPEDHNIVCWDLELGDA